MSVNNQIVRQYMGEEITDQTRLQEDTNSKYLVISSNSKLDLQFYTQGENIKCDIFAIFFGNKPLTANIISHIQNSNVDINVFILSFIRSDNLIDVQGSIDLSKNIINSQGHLLEKNIVIAPQGQKIKVKAIPRLDVYSKDVQATHGVSIDRISEESLFYLSSKGLDSSASQELVIRGHIQNILDQFTKISDKDKKDIENTILSHII